jgi:hypothetical protein
MAGKRYLITVEGGVHPQVHGPYASEEERYEEAGRLHAATDPETDAVFMADVGGDSELHVDTYAGADFAQVDADRGSAALLFPGLLDQPTLEDQLGVLFQRPRED